MEFHNVVRVNWISLINKNAVVCDWYMGLVFHFQRYRVVLAVEVWFWLARPS